MNNRSVPVNSLLPQLVYPNVDQAIRWLSHTFGFREHYRYGEPGNEAGAQLFAGDACIMLHRANNDQHVGPQTLTIFIQDVELHHSHSKEAGATIVEEPHETIYGEFQYAALDHAGHKWLFSRHARDVAPEEWGARVAT